jgi:hypothetical protein
MRRFVKIAAAVALAATVLHADEEVANYPHVTIDAAGRCYATSVPAAGYGSEGLTSVYEASPARRAALRAFGAASPAWLVMSTPDGLVRVRITSERDFAPAGDTLLHTFDGYAQELWLHCGEGADPLPSIVQAGPWPRGNRASAEHLALAFYHGGALVRRFSTLDIAGAPERVSASISHYRVFSEVRGFRKQGTASPAFEAVTTDGRRLTFDAASGAILAATTER